MLRLSVQAHPGARVEALRWREDGSIDAQVRAPALDGRATEAVLRLLADRLGLRPRQVRLIKGGRTRLKLIEVDLDDVATLRAKLGEQKAFEQSV